MLPAVCQSPPGPHISVFLFQKSKLSETCPRIRQVSWSIDIPIVIDALFLLDIQIRMSSPSSLHRHPEVSLEVVEEENLLILQENSFDFLLELGAPKWVFSVPDPIQKVWFVHLRLERWILLFSLWNITSFALFRCVHRFQLLNVCNQHVTFQFPATYRACPRNNPGKTFFPNWWILDWSFAENRVLLNQWTKRNDWSFQWFSKTPLVWNFPIR